MMRLSGTARCATRLDETQSKYPSFVTSIVVLTPIWRTKPTDAELALMRVSERNFADIPRHFLAPENLDVSFYRTEFPDWEITRFPNSTFANTTTYSRWLLTPGFYRKWEAFEHLAICQTDAVVVRDIRSAARPDIDYIGAPWVPPLRIIHSRNRMSVFSANPSPQGPWVTRMLGRRVFVGNGGLSVRRVSKHIQVTECIERSAGRLAEGQINEDALLCSLGPKKGLRVAGVDQAADTFLEAGAARLESVPSGLVGIHAIWRWNPNLARTLTSG